ncbi:MAG: hypothetical protein IKJ31_08700 [Bacteroidaceae bacterium]|nr:hypothetical protein [Bacteroidaceae bacterium]
MKAAVINKLSTYLFYVLMAVSAVVLLLFYLVGYDNMSQVAAGMVTDPANLDLLMYWLYALLAISVVAVLCFSVAQFFSSLKTNPKSAIKGIVSLVLFVVLFGGAYALADDSSITINGKAFDETGTLILTDVCIYVQYVLLAVATICTVVSLTGLFKFANKIKE